MPTEASLTRMLRSLGAERQRLDREIRRLENLALAQEADKSGFEYPPRSPELLSRLAHSDGDSPSQIRPRNRRVLP